MICQVCGKRPATTHVTRIVNGKRAEQHLCAECAKKQGLSPWGAGFDLAGLWNSLFAEPVVRSQADSERCPGCGSTLEDIARTGQVGCPECYVAFYDRLLPSVQRIHGKAQHAGKVPGAAGERVKLQQERERLEATLNDKIAAQAYEECAALRDQIRELDERLQALAASPEPAEAPSTPDAPDAGDQPKEGE